MDLAVVDEWVAWNRSAESTHHWNVRILERIKEVSWNIDSFLLVQWPATRLYIITWILIHLTTTFIGTCPAMNTSVKRSQGCLFSHISWNKKISKPAELLKAKLYPSWQLVRIHGLWNVYIPVSDKRTHCKSGWGSASFFLKRLLSRYVVKKMRLLNAVSMTWQRIWWMLFDVCHFFNRFWFEWTYNGLVPFVLLPAHIFTQIFNKAVGWLLTFEQEITIRS